MADCFHGITGRTPGNAVCQEIFCSSQSDLQNANSWSRNSARIKRQGYPLLRNIPLAFNIVLQTGSGWPTRFTNRSMLGLSHSNKFFVGELPLLLLVFRTRALHERGARMLFRQPFRQFCGMSTTQSVPRSWRMIFSLACRMSSPGRVKSGSVSTVFGNAATSVSHASRCELRIAVAQLTEVVNIDLDAGKSFCIARQLIPSQVDQIRQVFSRFNAESAFNASRSVSPSGSEMDAPTPAHRVKSLLQAAVLTAKTR